MSYCRFSSDGFQCDAYVYDDAEFGGLTIHLASQRYTFHEPVPPEPPISGDPALWFAWHQNIMALVEESPLEAIDDPWAGKSWCCLSESEALRILAEARRRGFRIPKIELP